METYRDRLNLNVAATILQQMGGRRFLYITGSKEPLVINNGLRMKLARNKTQANRLDVIYDEGKDLYEMRFYRLILHQHPLSVEIKEIVKHEDVYCEMLQSIFTEVTGLYTKL